MASAAGLLMAGGVAVGTAGTASASSQNYSPSQYCNNHHSWWNDDCDYYGRGGNGYHNGYDNYGYGGNGDHHGNGYGGNGDHHGNGYGGNGDHNGNGHGGNGGHNGHGR